MTQLQISNLSVQATLTSNLQAQQASLTLLSTQLSTQQQHSDLTDYSATDARTLISLQASATQKQAYLNVINGVNSNLTIYDAGLTDLESIIMQAQSLANNNPTYSADIATNVGTQASNYLRSTTVDLNQQVNGRYIYAGTRYSTAPVQDLSNLPAASLSPTIQTDGSTLPSYDSASTLYMATSGQAVTVNGVVAAGQVATVTVNGTAYSYTALSTDTPTSIATNLAGLITAGGVSTTSSGATLTVGGAGIINSAVAVTADPNAYSTDTANIDTKFSVNYGVSSDDPAMQQMIAGLRYLQAAGNSTDAATYQANITQANTLLTSALKSIQNVHTQVAENINLMTTEKARQNTNITDLTDQVDNIQQVDITQVSAQITSLQTILQASYAVTGDIEKMSIVNYL